MLLTETFESIEFPLLVKGGTLGGEGWSATTFMYVHEPSSKPHSVNRQTLLSCHSRFRMHVPDRSEQAQPRAALSARAVTALPFCTRQAMPAEART